MQPSFKEARRVALVQAPIIPYIADLVRETPGAISLGQGVVGYGPPPEALARVPAFLQDPDCHRYGDVDGYAPLVSRIEAKLARDNGIAVAPGSRLVVTAGGNMAFVHAVLAVTDPDDEVIVLTPYYFNHDMAIGLAGCRTVAVPTDERYQPQLDLVRRAITSRTRAIVTISPNNPTGAVYGRTTLEAVNALCRERGLYHISDEVYEYFTYGGARHFSPGSLAGACDHTISLYSLSKAYGIAGWRVGYMVIPAALYGAVSKVQDTVIISPPIASQFTAAAALDVGRGYCDAHVARLGDVHDLVLEEVRTIADICDAPAAEGAFYLLVRVHGDFDSLVTAERLIREHGVGVIPGSAFGMTEGCYLRVAYGALDRETVKEGIGRLTRGLREIVKNAPGTRH